jgi:hypothetical protein
MFEWLTRLLSRAGRRGDPRSHSEGTTVAVIEDGRLVPWQRVDRLDEAGPEERVFAVDPATGTIRFGDGVHGREPDPGQVMRVRSGGSGAVGNIGDVSVRLIEYEIRYGDAFKAQSLPGKIHQIMPAGGWKLVEKVLGGERLTPLVGWALLDPYVPPFREGGQPYIPAEQSVRGLIAHAGGTVRIVDELAQNFAGYRED